MTTIMIAVVGVALLVWLGVLAGTQLDTRAQRRARKRIAAERRALAERSGGSAFVVRRCDPDQLCARCPFR